MRPKLQKQSALKLVGRIMPSVYRGGKTNEVKFEALAELSCEAEGTIHRRLLRNVSKAYFGVRTRD